MAEFILPDELKLEEEETGFVLPDELKITEQPIQLLDEDGEVNVSTEDPSLARMGAALATEIAIAEGGRQASALGGPISYVVGSLISGAAGSIAAQKITNPDDISEGRVIADAFINLIPGLKAAKGRGMYADAAMRQAPLGAGIGIAGIAGETIIDEGRLPTGDELASAGITGGLLGGALGVTGAAINSVLLRHGGSPVEQLTKVIRGGEDADLDTIYKNIKNFCDEDLTIAQQGARQRVLNLREMFTDDAIKVRQLQKESGAFQYNEGGPLELKEYTDPSLISKDNPKGIVSRDDQDYYQTRRNQPGKIDGGYNLIVGEHNLSMDELATAGIKLNGRTSKELSDSIDNYLHAKYAIDYNLKTGEGAAGMSTAQAKTIIKEFEGANLHKELANPIKTLKEQINRTNERAVEGGLVSREKLNTWKKEYGENYVPLYRLVDEDIQLKSRTPNAPGEVKWSGIYDDVGSEDLKVKSIRENIYRQEAEIIRRAEVNKSSLAFVKLINAPQNKEAAKALLKDIDGKKFGKAGNLNKRPSDAAFTFMDKGETKYMELADEGIARALRGTPYQEMGTITQLVYDFASGMNRRLGALYTRFNPDFVIPNLFRDATEASVNNSVRLGAKQGAATLNPYKTVTDDMNTIYRKQRNLPAETPRQKELYRLYDEFKEDGGSVGGLAGTTKEQLIDQVNKLTDNMTSSSPMVLGRKVTRFFDDWNNVFEDATRFKTYKLAREAGKSRQSAALAARDSSFDPRLGGTNVNVVRASFLFANPAIQASKVFLKNLYQKPKFAMGFMGTLFGIKMGLDKWNSSIDPDWEEKLRTTTGSDFVKNKSLVFLTGVDEEGKPEYISMPIGYSMVPFAVAADYAQKAATGKVTNESYLEQGANIFSEMTDAYIPVGRNIVPTPLTPFTDLMQNKDGLGRTIRPEWLETKNMAQKENMFPYTMDTFGGEMAFALAETAERFGLETSPENIKYLAEKFTGGPGKTFSNLINIVSAVKNGQPLKKNQIPIARRFMGDGYAEKFEERAGTATEVEEFTRIDNTERAREARISSSLFRRLKDARENERFEEASDIISDAIESGTLTPSVLKKLTRRIKEDKKGLTQTDSRIKALSIKTRGKYLIKQMQKMTPSEIKAYLRDQTTKGVLTKSVMKDIDFVKSFQSIRERLRQ